MIDIQAYSEPQFYLQKLESIGKTGKAQKVFKVSNEHLKDLR